MHPPPPPPRPPKRHSCRPRLLVAPPVEGASVAPARPVVPAPPGSTRERRASDSEARVRAGPAVELDFLDALDVLDELRDEQHSLDVGVAGLLRSSAATVASAEAATAGLADLVALHEGLRAVRLRASDRSLQSLFLPDAPLVDYLRGLYAWGDAMVRALADFVRESRPDAGRLAGRLEHAKNFHFDELHDAIRADLAKAPQREAGALGDALERLFVVGCGVEGRRGASSD